MVSKSPLEIRKVADGIFVRWRDGTASTISSEVLRRNCPCAECKMKRGEDSHSAPLTPKKKSLLAVIEHTKDEAISLEEIWGVGQYALGMRWGDGHDTGIYPFEYLRDSLSLL